MTSLGSNGEQSSEVMELIKKFPTSAFVARRLHEVGWGSDYGQSLLNHFREELLRNVGMSYLRYSNNFERSIHPPDDEWLNSQGFAVLLPQVVIA